MPPKALSNLPSAVWEILTHIFSGVLNVAIRIGTLPYYRLYNFNTIDPLNRIADLANQAPYSTSMLKVIAQWRIRKLTEQQFISISCAVLAAAVIGSFSWTTIEEAYWLTHGFWHTSLVLSILGILLSASQITVLNSLGPLPNRQRGTQTRDSIKRYEPLLLSYTGSKFIPRRKMLFLWQCPMMFMSYSVCAFLAGLSVLVCTPLIRHKDDWTAGCNIAVMYLTVCAIAGPIFLFCSFWVYHYVDLDFDTSSQESDEDDSARPSYGPSHLFLPPSMHAAASPMTPGSFNMVEDTRMKLQSGREDGSRF